MWTTSTHIALLRNTRESRLSLTIGIVGLKGVLPAHQNQKTRIRRSASGMLGSAIFVMSKLKSRNTSLRPELSKNWKALVRSRQYVPISLRLVSQEHRCRISNSSRKTLEWLVLIVVGSQRIHQEAMAADIIQSNESMVMEAMARMERLGLTNILYKKATE